MTLKKYREDAGLAVSELAKSAGIDERTIRSLESLDGSVASGSRPRKSTISRYLVGCGYAKTDAEGLAKKFLNNLNHPNMAEKPPQWLVKTLNNAIELNASDIHIDATSTRFRISGELKAVIHPKVPDEFFEVKGDHCLVDFRYSHKSGGREYIIRGCGIPGIHGAEVRYRFTLRILPPVADMKIYALENIFLCKKQLDAMRYALQRESGLILLSGPCGSGLSTTHAALLMGVASHQINVMSIEDPVEILIPDVNQCVVNNETGATHGSVLRSMMRSDPDVISVGNIRNEEIADMVVQCVRKGYLVLGSIHSESAKGALKQLNEYGISEDIAREICIVSVNQRLKCALDPTDGRFPIVEIFSPLPNLCSEFKDALEAAVEEELITEEIAEKYVLEIGPQRG